MIISSVAHFIGIVEILYYKRLKLYPSCHPPDNFRIFIGFSYTITTSIPPKVRNY